MELEYAESIAQVTLGFGGFELSEVTYLIQAASSGSVFIDVGANVGYHSLAMATLRPDVTVHALEPSDDAATRYMIWAAGLPNVHLHPVAAGDKRGRVLLDRPPDGAFARVIGELNSEAGNVGTAATTLDEMWMELGCPAVSVIKVDVEGYEDRVLKGASGLLAGERPVLLIESHDRETTRRLLDGFGYRKRPSPKGFEPWNHVYEYGEE